MLKLGPGGCWKKPSVPFSCGLSTCSRVNTAVRGVGNAGGGGRRGSPPERCAPRGRSGAGARRRRGRRGAVQKGGRSAVGTARHRCGREAGPACPLAAATVREADPAGAPGSGARGGGRGGALTSPPLPRGLREGEREGGAPREAAIRRSSRPQLPNSAARLPGQVLTNLVSPRPSRTRLLFRCSSFFPQDGKPPEMRPPGRRGRIAPSLGTW